MCWWFYSLPAVGICEVLFITFIWDAFLLFCLPGFLSFKAGLRCHLLFQGFLAISETWNFVFSKHLFLNRWCNLCLRESPSNWSSVIWQSPSCPWGLIAGSACPRYPDPWMLISLTEGMLCPAYFTSSLDYYCNAYCSVHALQVVVILNYKGNTDRNTGLCIFSIVASFSWVFFSLWLAEPKGQ